MGASVSQQCLRAGLGDELHFHVANVLLGEGRPLFADVGPRQVRLERVAVIATPAVTHLMYRIVKWGYPPTRCERRSRRRGRRRRWRSGVLYRPAPAC
ncbi:MAG TPA: dihydrofolate reductase family protein [Chloroflexota bacterium]